MKLKKVLLIGSGLIGLTSCVGGGGSSATSIDTQTTDTTSSLPVSKTIELLPDNHFENGFIAYPGTRAHLDGSYPSNDWNANVYLKYDENTPNPSWQLQQIGCINDLNDIYNPMTKKMPDYEAPYYKFEGVSNYVYVDPNDGEIILGLNASKDYDAPRQSGDWCHLLLQNVLTQSVKVSELESLKFAIDLELEVERKMTDEEYDLLIDMMEVYGIDDGFMQDPSDDDILWIPDFRKDIPFPEPFSDPDPVFLSIKHR